MKKHLLTSAVGLLTLCALNAAPVDELVNKHYLALDIANELVDGNWYIMYNANRSACISEEIADNGSFSYKMRALPSANGVASDVAGKLFKVTKEGEYYHFQSGNGTYFEIVSSGCNKSDAPVNYILHTSEYWPKSFWFQHASTNIVGDGQNEDLAFLGYGTSGPNSRTSSNSSYQFLNVSLIEDDLQWSWDEQQAKAAEYAYKIQSAYGLVTAKEQYLYNYKASGDGGDYDALIDGNYDTYTHSAYSGDAVAAGTVHWVQANIGKAIGDFRFFFQRRSQNNNNRPINITVQGSNDNVNYVDIVTLSDGFPTKTRDRFYMSPVINGGEYSYIRLRVNQTSNNTIYFTFSELYFLPDNENVSKLAEVIQALNTDYPTSTSAVAASEKIDEYVEILEGGIVDITYKLPTYNGYEPTITRLGVPVGSDLSDAETLARFFPSVDFFSNAVVTSENKTVSKNNATFQVTGTYNFPIAFNNVYSLTLRPDDRKPLKYDGTNALTTYEGNSFGLGYLWYFKFKGYDNDGKLKMTLHNLQAGDNLGVTMATSNTAATLTDNPTELLYFISTRSNRKDGDFCLRGTGSNQQWVNEHGGNGKLATWNTSDPRADMGSQIRLASLSEEYYEILSIYNTPEELADAKANPTPAKITALFENLNTNLADEYDIIVNANSFIHLGIPSTAGIKAWNDFLTSIKDAQGGEETHNSIVAAYEALVASSSNLENEVYIKLSPNSTPGDYLIVFFSDHTFKVERYGTNHNVNKTTWTLKPAEGGFKMYNEYSGKYLNLPPSREGDGISAAQSQVQPVGESEAAIYTFELYDAATSRYSIRSVASPDDYLHNNSNTYIVKYGKYENSSWYLHASDAETAQNEANLGATADLADATSNFLTNSTPIAGTGVGQYQGNVSEYNAALSAYNALDESSTNAEKHAVAADLRELYPSLTLNMPRSGHFYRLSNVGDAKYLSSNQKSNRLAFITKQNHGDIMPETVFFFDGTYLSLFNDGYVIDNGVTRNKVLSTADNAGSVEFLESNLTGKYYIRVPNDNVPQHPEHTHYFFYNESDDDYLDSGSVTNNLTDNRVGYRWTLTDVQWLPIPGSAANGWTTFCAPVAVNTRANVAAYRFTEENGTVTLTKIAADASGVIPANTPVALHFNGADVDETTGLVYLKVSAAVDEAVTVEGESHLARTKGNANYITMSEGEFAALTATTIPGFKGVLEVAETHEGYSMIEDKLQNVLNDAEGKVYTIRSSDASRGYLAYKEGGEYIHATRNESVDLNSDNYKWTFVSLGGKSYLYNLGAQKFAAAYMPHVGEWPNNNQNEFAWHFSDYPTAVNADIHDWADEESVLLSNSIVSILGGQNTLSDTRDPGMMIIAVNTNGKVPCIAGAEHKNGYGFKFDEVGEISEEELAPLHEKLTAARTEMETAYEYANAANIDDHGDIIGYYTIGNLSNFKDAFTPVDDEADAETKYYAVVRGHNAVTDKQYNTFADNYAYQLMTGVDEYINAVAVEPYWAKGEEQTHADGNVHSSNWHATVNEDGTVTFSHTLMVSAEDTETESGTEPASMRRRAKEYPTQEVTASITATPVYDGLGNVELNVEGIGKVRVNTVGDDTNNELTTPIREVEAAAEQGAEVIYDLQGRRINRAGHGLYIINGRKMLVK